MEPRACLNFDRRIVLPNHALFVGASQSGKTRLCLHLICNPHLLHPKPKRIIFHYDQIQEKYIEAKRHLQSLGIELLLIKGCKGISLDNYQKQDSQTILILDDFSHESSSSPEIARIATNGRHINLSLWCMWHSLYASHPASRIMCQNVRWFFLLPSLRLASQLRTFGSQLGMKNLLLWAYGKCQDDESEEYRYLLVDAGPNTPRILRLRSRVHHTELQYCYE